MPFFWHKNFKVLTKYLVMKKLLVIDDENDFCTLVKMHCNKKGIECLYANTLAEGMILLNNCAPDILILDNNLPDGYGWQKVDYVLDTFPKVKVNLVTAKNVVQKSNIVNDDKYNMVLHYAKPLSITQLDNILHERKMY